MLPQFGWQLPGPLGSPQEPQGPAKPPEGWPELLEPTVAKTESCLSSFRLPQAGQAGFSEPVTRVSKLFLQSLQT